LPYASHRLEYRRRKIIESYISNLICGAVKRCETLFGDLLLGGSPTGGRSPGDRGSPGFGGDGGSFTGGFRRRGGGFIGGFLAGGSFLDGGRAKFHIPPLFHDRAIRTTGF
jgi:hypothetical protein